MGPEIEDDIMPLFIINGFLEAGKTQFLQFTMGQDYFQTEKERRFSLSVRREIRSMIRSF